MSEQEILDLGARAALLSIKLAAPALLAIMVVGFVVSVFQAATQIQEQTLAFIPKVIAMTLVLMVAGPWILQSMVQFTHEMFAAIARVTR